MLSFISAKEAAEKWNISQRRVSVLCSENRIEGAMMVGNMWIIPSTADKPIDKRLICYDRECSTIVNQWSVAVHCFFMSYQNIILNTYI